MASGKQQDHNGGGSSLENGIRNVLRRAQENVSDSLHQYEETVRHSPANSVVVAGLVGYFLHILPIGSVISAVLRIFTALLRPAIFLYIAAKLIDLIRSSTVAEGQTSKSKV